MIGTARISLLEVDRGAGETEQWLQVLAVLTEDLDLDFSTQGTAHACL